MEPDPTFNEGIINYIKIDHLINSPKKVILLFGMDKFLSSEQLFALSQWLLGAKLAFSQKGEPIYEPCKLNGVKEHFLTYFGGKKLIQILETDSGLIISLNIHEWVDIDKSKNVEEETMKKFVEKSLFMEYILKKIVEFECQVKAYTAFEYNKKVERENLKEEITSMIKKYMNIKSVGLLQFNYPDNQPSEIDYLIAREGFPACTFKSQKLFEGVRQISENLKACLDFITDMNGLKERIKTMIIEKGIAFEKHLKEFVDIFLAAANVNSKLDESRYDEGCEHLQEKFQKMISDFHQFCQRNKVKELFENEEVEDILPYFQKVKINYCDNHVPRSKDIHPSLAKYVFYSEFRRMYVKISRKKEIHSIENYSKIQDYLRHIVSLFRELYEGGYEQMIKKCLTYILKIILQMQTLNSIQKSPTTVFNAIIDHIKKNLFLEEDFARVVLDIPMKKDKEISYYESLLELIHDNVDEREVKKKDAQEVKTKKNYYVMFIQHEQTKKMIKKYLGKNDKEIANAIYKLFDIYDRRNNIEEHYQKQFNFHQILLKCARLLRSIGQSQYAIKIYKKLKYFRKVEDCFQEIILELEGQDKIKKYLEYAQYFGKIGDRNLSWEYIQKAFEENNSQEYLEKILKAKSIFFESKGDEASEQKNLIKKIVDKSIPSEKYFCDYDLGKNFKTQLMELQDIVREDNDYERVQFQWNQCQSLIR